MNSNIDRIINKVAESIIQALKTSVTNDTETFCNECINGPLTKSLMNRPFKRIRISRDALKTCVEHGISPYDYFILPQSQLKKKCGHFFDLNEKITDDCPCLTGNHNPPDKQMLADLFKAYEKNPNIDIFKIKSVLNKQSLDLITIEESEQLNKAGYKDYGTASLRDNYCSEKIDFTDLWLTPHYVIDKFFESTGLDRNKCLDPCAADGRWLQGQGISIDILPASKNVIEKNFLSMTREEVPDNITTIVGNIPFSLLNEFVNKALELRDECYFLVNGDNIFKYFNKQIEHLYVFHGFEGNPKDNRSRCEFDVPFLFKAALWCCIVHIKKDGDNHWEVESGIDNDAKKDGNHIAIGKNAFIKTNGPVKKDPRVSIIEVAAHISFNGGKIIKMDDGEIIDFNQYIGNLL